MKEHCEYECVDYEKHEEEIKPNVLFFPTLEELLKITALCMGIMLNERKKLQKKHHEQEQKVKDKPK
jgi:hypothetical protein